MPTVRTKIDRLLGVGDGLEIVCPRSIILKNPRLQGRTIEKGVLLVTFSESFPLFRRELDLPLLLKYFSIILEPSGAGYGTPEILFWLDYPEHPVVVQATENADFRFLTRLRSNLIPVSFGASDWVDHRRFRPLPDAAKVYDSVYVANYKGYKRCHSYFRALARVKRGGLRAALVCDSWGGSREEVLTIARHYGITEILDLYENLSQPELNVVLNHSKVNLLLSLKEGSNRSIFEGFAADVPGIVLRENIGVNKTYINARTGLLVDETDLPDALMHFRSNWQRYSPRAWALENISPEKTTSKLTECLKSLARERGEPWTKDPVPKINAPEVSYFNEADRHEFPRVADVLMATSRSRTPPANREATLRGLLRSGEF
jgi:glycosyltransferase involved in cell wall biosynthesis